VPTSDEKNFATKHNHSAVPMTSVPSVDGPDTGPGIEALDAARGATPTAPGVYDGEWSVGNRVGHTGGTGPSSRCRTAHWERRQLVVTALIVTVPSFPALCEVTASPARRVGPRLMVNVEPAIGVQLTPSTDMAAVKVFPDRVTCR
jgi:hypothetical protein